MVVGLIAGGDSAIRKAVEFAEDNENHQAWEDLKEYMINHKDTLSLELQHRVGTPYVIGGLKAAREKWYPHRMHLQCNLGSKLAWEAEYPH